MSAAWYTAKAYAASIDSMTTGSVTGAVSGAAIGPSPKTGSSLASPSHYDVWKVAMPSATYAVTDPLAGPLLVPHNGR